MYIHKAIQARTKQKPYITRKAWNDLYPMEAPGPAIWILPTDSPDGCVIDSQATRSPCRRWQPTAEDLVADDWMITTGGLT